MTLIAPPIAAAPPAPSIASASVAPYPPEVHSVRFVKTSAVRKAPRLDAEPVGIVRRGTRAAAERAGGPCDGAARWIAIAPRGWACEDVLAASLEPPTPAPDVSFDDDDEAVRRPVQGVYGMVRGDARAFATRDDAAEGENGRDLIGNNTVRAAGVVTIDGRRFWRTTRGELIDEASIVELAPSRFKGTAIADPAAMPAWVRSRRDPYAPLVTRAEPSPRAAVTGKLAPRARVAIAERSDDGAWARVGDAAWVELADLRVATIAPPPPGTAPGEKWFDVDRDQQILVAYEGERPVYATLVSTGRYQHETPTSVARVFAKLETAVMSSDKESIYSVADVPWTMYYDRDFALHTSYWHDGFGSPRSHGCINLAPRDARLLYRWSSPDVPPGWIAVYGDRDNPGSLVRVRTAAVPEPAFRGYARELL